jgi:hypothetical protein
MPNMRGLSTTMPMEPGSGRCGAWRTWAGRKTPRPGGWAHRKFCPLGDFQHHVAPVLEKPFLHRVIVKIHPAVGAAHDHDDHARIGVQHLVGDGRLQQVPVRLDPIFEIEGP